MRIWIAALLWASLTVASWAQAPVDGLALKAGMLRDGDYLFHGYVEKLKSTQSLTASLNVGETPQVISVYRKGSLIEVSANWNWHEGCQVLTVNLDKSDGDVKYAECSFQPAFRLLDGQTVMLGDDQYDYVEGAERYISDLLLVGDYKDDRGRQYAFTIDGHAIFPGKQFKFGLCLDQIGPECGGFDSFWNGAEQYAFRRSRDQLTIYGMKPVPGADFEQPDYAKPLFVLHRVPGR